ncbi:MAG: Rrf2 family transcriptional regulator [Treponema sp.]|jgi:DNA-binding IscR family transcriptional regulator|nr:Rrf2 family transcriptional regulator [Treponema sp.]MDR1353667.1 Rrf2 family transcriptional regulator [Treponema sp.]
MQIGIKFSVAIHIMLCADVFRDECKITSDFIASSVRTNPVIIRKIAGRLRDAGLIEIAPGTGGLRLARKPGKISLRDIFLAVEPVKDGKLFKIHGGTEPKCRVGAYVPTLLGPYFAGAQSVMEQYLSKSTLQNLLDDLKMLWT